MKRKNKVVWDKWMEAYTFVLEQTPELKEFGGDTGLYDAARKESMNSRVNPAFILRTYQMEEAIRDAEKGNFDKVN